MVAVGHAAGRKAFSLTPEFASASKVLAANQGLYNGFLAAGLIWGLYLGAAGFQIKVFFLICVAIAGLFGAVTVGRKILFIQTAAGNAWRWSHSVWGGDQRDASGAKVRGVRQFRPSG